MCVCVYIYIYTHTHTHTQIYIHTYMYASLNDGDTFWETRRWAISSLCERHRVYLHKT
jgi:hypothetical protein